MFSALGIRYVDHFAVTTESLMTTLTDYLSLPGARLINGPGKNTAQDVLFAFVQLAQGSVVEILAPLNEQSPIHSHLKQGGGSYHVCYAVEDLASAIKTATQNFGARLIRPERADDAFYGRKVAFLFHPNHGLFELVEAWPNGISEINPCNLEKPVSIKSVVTHYNYAETLLDIFNRTMQTEYTIENTLTMDLVPEWDSLKHLLLLMEIERIFEINIPADDLADLDSMDKILKYIQQATK